MVAMEKVDLDRQFASEKYSNQCKWDGFVKQILVYLKINASKPSNNVNTEQEKKKNPHTGLSSTNANLLESVYSRSVLIKFFCYFIVPLFFFLESYFI